MKIGRRTFLGGLVATVAALTTEPGLIRAAPAYIPSGHLGMGVPRALKPERTTLVGESGPEIVLPTFEEVIQVRSVTEGWARDGISFERTIKPPMTGYLYGLDDSAGWLLENVRVETMTPEEQERRNREWLRRFEAEWDGEPRPEAVVMPEGSRLVRMEKYGPKRVYEADWNGSGFDQRAYGEISLPDGTVHRIEYDSMSPIPDETG